MASLQIAPYGRTSRTPRRPQHTFNVAVRPWQIVPILIAPVLPGETLKNMLFQSRVVTDPIKNALSGWWLEYYFFYVKHRDLNERDNLTKMMIDPAFVMPTTAAKAEHNQFPNSVNYVDMCLRRIVETYFRDQGEAWDAALMGIYPAAQVSQQTVLDSALLESKYLTGAADDLVVGADDTITGAELSQSWILWQQYRASNITTLSYEEYLATYGIPLPAGAESSHRPELIRYVKEWSYPTNTVDPLTGVPTSAVSWAVSERADKDRFFREPGFIFGVTVVRPKVLLNQAGTVTGALKDALSWLPAVMGDNPEYSVRKFTAASGPFTQVTADYRVDLKDLFLYGEQYHNAATGGTPPVSGAQPFHNSVALPTAALQKKYPGTVDADSVFKSPAANCFIRMDGVASLHILGMQVDTTPTTAPGGF